MTNPPRGPAAEAFTVWQLVLIFLLASLPWVFVVWSGVRWLRPAE